VPGWFCGDKKLIEGTDGQDQRALRIQIFVLEVGHRKNVKRSRTGRAIADRSR
jgi:hypothetical protein